MTDHVYHITEIVGSSEVGTDDAIRTAITRASATLRHIRWFEVVETRGHVESGAVMHFQVTLKVGFTLEETADTGTDHAPKRVDVAPEPGTDPLHEGP